MGLRQLAKKVLPPRAVAVIKALPNGPMDLLDYGYRWINHRMQYPPWSLRKYVGPLETVETSPARWQLLLCELGGMKPDARVLDIGCGFGLLALFLEEYLGEAGHYEGFDLYRRAIRWADATITQRNPRFVFHHLDICNGMYNRFGKLRGEDVRFPCADGAFDFVTLKSVFTHMQPHEVGHYMDEIRRVLAPGGKCFASLFLLNDHQNSLAGKGLNRLDFRHGSGVNRYASEACPEAAMAYDEKYILEEFRKRGFELTHPVLYGTWSGRKAVEYQDILILRKTDPPS